MDVLQGTAAAGLTGGVAMIPPPPTAGDAGGEAGFSALLQHAINGSVEASSPGLQLPEPAVDPQLAQEAATPLATLPSRAAPDVSVEQAASPPPPDKAPHKGRAELPVAGKPSLVVAQSKTLVLETGMPLEKPAPETPESADVASAAAETPGKGKDVAVEEDSGAPPTGSPEPPGNDMRPALVDRPAFILPVVAEGTSEQPEEPAAGETLSAARLPRKVQTATARQAPTASADSSPELGLAREQGAQAAPVGSNYFSAPAAAAEPARGSASAPRDIGSPTHRLSLADPVGERLGAVIARRLSESGEEVQVRMDPAELGRVHVRLSFDEGGSLRAVVAADSPQVLDAIRRDAGELGRALADAGVRIDAQSFRFDRGHHSGGGGDLPRQWTRQNRPGSTAQTADQAEAPVEYRPLRGSGRLNLMA